MTRQLKISEEVHFMLTLLKPFDSTSYDEVIHGLIENAAPYLPDRLKDLSDLAKVDPAEYAEQIDALQTDLFEDYYVEGLLRRREERQKYLDELAIDRAIEEQEGEEEAAVDRYLEEQERQREETIDQYIDKQSKLQKKPLKPVTKKAKGIPKKRSEKK